MNHNTIQMKKIYKDSKGRFELVNPWLNWIRSHWSHFWDGAYFPYSLHSILNIYKWRKNMEYKENWGALFTCLTQNWIPWQIAHNHTIHQIVFFWLAPKCLTHYTKFTKSSENLEPSKPNKKIHCMLFTFILHINKTLELT